MILDGEILAYFDEIGVDVEANIMDSDSRFNFLVSFYDFSLPASITIERELNLLTFELKIDNPSIIEFLSLALNALNSNSRLFKAYYDKLEDSITIKAISFVREENLISTMDYMITSALNMDSDYIENLYNTVFKENYESLEDDMEFDKMHEDTSIEEDMQELMELLKSKKGL